MVKNKVIIITGNKGEGKTTKLQRIVKLIKKEKISMTGFLAYADLKDGDREHLRVFILECPGVAGACHRTQVQPDVDVQEQNQ